MNIGIDLGTTFSAIAVYGEVNTKGNYLDGEYLSECNVTIIPSPMGELTIPSAFWCDPNDEENKLVGVEAKEKAGEGGTPILFSKRSIGTTQILKIGDKEFTAKQVATEILKYLKKCAEDALGVPIYRAVITHPAYFSLNQVEETRQAAVDAGFDMSFGEQMINEPAAATIAFISSNPLDNITALTYDLGGGTFDVTVLERKDGEILMKAFDGDHLLGGYDFDKCCIMWLLERVNDRLKGTGRSISLDENTQAGKECWARMLRLAEMTKIELVKKPTPKVPYNIKADNILFDNEGKPIQINERITREEYTALVKDLLDVTIEKSMDAIKKAKLTSDQIDVIVLVGGSTYGQWVQEAVAAAFPGIEINTFIPDKCVAAGAAICAYNLPGGGEERHPDSEYEILADVPRVTLHPTINIIVTVKKKGGVELNAAEQEHLKLLLIAPDDVISGPNSMNENGVFIFPEIELLDDAPTNFILRLVDAESKPVAEQSLSIEYNPDSQEDIFPSLNVLPKSIYLKTASGLFKIGNEGDKLPVKSREIKLIKIGNDAIIELPIYQGQDWITTINVDGVTDEIEEGSSILLSVEITRKNIMRGIIKVKKLDESIVTEWPIEISFPPIQILEKSDLQDTFSLLEARLQQAIYNERDPAKRTKLNTNGDKLVRGIKKLFDEPYAEIQKIQENIKKLEELLTPEKDEMQAKIEDFNNIANECRSIISKVEKHQTQQNQDALKRIEKDAFDASDQKDQKKWNIAFAQLESLYNKLSAPEKEDKDSKLPDTDILKLHCYKRVVEALQVSFTAKKGVLESNGTDIAKFAVREKMIDAEIKKLKDQIMSIDDQTDPKVASQKLQAIELKKPDVDKLIRKFGETVELQ